ncbi:MAG: tetratricopeptide repeat protein [Hyphomicrobiales bacterium]
MRIHRLKDVDSAERVSALKAFAWTCPILAVTGFFLQGWAGAAAAVPVAFGLSVLVQMAAGLLATLFVGLIFGSGRRTIPLRERLSGSVSQARYSKMHGEHARALAILDEVLGRDPDFVEALFLKAEVLWEGFGRGAEARGCLARVGLIETDPRATYHRWARTLIAEIADAERKAGAPAGGSASIGD